MKILKYSLLFMLACVSLLIGIWFWLPPAANPMTFDGIQLFANIRWLCNQKLTERERDIMSFGGAQYISFPFPDSWPPTDTTGVWYTFAPNEYRYCTPYTQNACTKERSASCDSTEIDADNLDKLFAGGTVRKRKKYDPPIYASEARPFFLFRIRPSIIDSYAITIDTVRCPYSDWLLESSKSISHPGQQDLFRAIKEHRLPSREEKARIREFYLANVIDYRARNYKHLQPGQREFLDWLITE